MPSRSAHPRLMLTPQLLNSLLLHATAVPSSPAARGMLQYTCDWRFFFFFFFIKCIQLPAAFCQFVLTSLSLNSAAMAHGYTLACSVCGTIKGCQTQTGKLWLQAKYSWVVTGTPFHSSFEDLFSYILFLKHTPFDTKPALRQFLLGVMTSHNPKAGIQQVYEILKPIMLRRHTGSIMDCCPIVNLHSR